MLTVEEKLDYLNRLTSITSNPAVGSATSYTYTYNDANQRQLAELENGEYWAYNYDSLGQVSSGKKHDKIGATPDPETDPLIVGHDYGYTFDDIGNRTQASTNGRNAAYTPNLLNHYTQRDVPGFFNIVGQAGTDPGLAITANATVAARTDNYFHAEVPVDNSAGPVWEEITVTGVVPGAGEGGSDAVAEETGYKFLEKDPVAPAYDDDGNLSSDGRWSYTWNAENRLIEMTPLPAAISAGAPNKRLQFTYDNLGRRIKKSVSVWSGNAYIWVRDNVFLYDGWNPIYERIVKASFGLVEERKYVWGLDLTGTLRDAGGIGGLLFIERTNHQEQTNEVWYPVYDGIGNVVALIDAVSGGMVASYEYDAFGKPIRATGTAANYNPFRFSTKYTDAETSLTYYGLRYYNPIMGRWLSRDPIGELGGLNLYGMVGNNPLNFVDPLGLAECPFPKWSPEKCAEASRQRNFWENRWKNEVKKQALFDSSIAAIEENGLSEYYISRINSAVKEMNVDFMSAGIPDFLEVIGFGAIVDASGFRKRNSSDFSNIGVVGTVSSTSNNTLNKNIPGVLNQEIVDPRIGFNAKLLSKRALMLDAMAEILTSGISGGIDQVTDKSYIKKIELDREVSRNRSRISFDRFFWWGDRWLRHCDPSRFR